LPLPAGRPQRVPYVHRNAASPNLVEGCRCTNGALDTNRNPVLPGSDHHCIDCWLCRWQNSTDSLHSLDVGIPIDASARGLGSCAPAGRADQTRSFLRVGRFAPISSRDEIVFTLPFYVSVAYSGIAFFVQRRRRGHDTLRAF